MNVGPSLFGEHKLMEVEGVGAMNGAFLMLARERSNVLSKCGRRGEDERTRLQAVDRCGEFAERCGNVTEAAIAWEEVAAAWRAAADDDKLAESNDAWPAPTSWILQLGQEAAAHLDVQETHSEPSSSAGPAGLRARAIGLEGHIRAALGEGAAGVELTRKALNLAIGREVLTSEDGPEVARMVAAGKVGLILANRGDTGQARKHLARAAAYNSMAKTKVPPPLSWAIGWLTDAQRRSALGSCGLCGAALCPAAARPRRCAPAAPVFDVASIVAAPLAAELPGAYLPWPEGTFGLATMVVFSVVNPDGARLTVRPRRTIRLVLLLHSRTEVLLELMDRNPWIIPAYARRPRDRCGLEAPPGRGRLRDCTRISGRNPRWPLPNPHEPGLQRRTLPLGGT